jgi:hydrogenase-4 component F
MIFPLYLICGVVLLGIMLIPVLRRSEKSSINQKIRFLNSATVVLCTIYLAITIYVISSLELPFTGFKDYLFIDPLAIYEVLITCIVFWLAALYGHGYIKTLVEKEGLRAGSLELFYLCFNLLFMVIVFAFFCNNLALFWILLELTTVLSAVLIVALSAKENIIAALKYVFIASTAMLFSVAGLIILFAMTKQALGEGTLNWTTLMQSAALLSPKYLGFALIFVFIGFASKAGIAPFHTWLPQAHARAPSVVSAVLSGVLLNGGIYGILRVFAIAHRTSSWKVIAIVMLVFGMISIAVAAFSMLPRSNIKKLIAFSSIEHMGLVLVAISLATPLAIFWSLFHILAHALIKTLLFFSSGILNRQFNSNRFEDMKNVFKLQPLAAWGIILGSIAVIGMPPFPMFISKLFILTQIGHYSFILLAVVLVLLLIVAGAFAYLLIKGFTRQSETRLEAYKVHWTMKAPIVVLIILILGIGAYLGTGLQPMLQTITLSLGF